MKVIRKTTLRRSPSMAAGFLCAHMDSKMKKMKLDSMNYLRVTGTVAVVGLAVILSMTLAPVYNKEMSAEATAGVSTDSVLTFNSISDLASVNLSVSSANGTFATSSDGTGTTIDQRAHFAVSTNNYTGYTLKISSSGDITSLVNSADSTKAILSITDTDGISRDTFDTVDYNNKWGYMPSSYRSGGSNIVNDTLYFPAPTSDNARTLAVTSAQNSSNGIDNADDYTIGLGLRADYTNPAGTYVNDTFLIQFVANAVEYRVNFANGTGDSSVAGLPATITGDSTVTGVILPDDIPTRTGYAFSGWCFGNTSEGGTKCDGSVYSAGGLFNIDLTQPNNVTLYSVWTINQYSLFIDFDGEGVSSVKVCTVSGNCDWGDMKGEVSESGGEVSNLDYNATYYLYPVFDDGYTIGPNGWTNEASYGVLGLTNRFDLNPTFKVGLGAGRVAVDGEVVVACNPSGNNIDDIACMQDISDSNKAAIISSMNSGTQYTLRDNRDQQKYTVAKMNDGNVWMTQNLDLCIGCAGVEDLTSENTDLNEYKPEFAGYTIPSGIITWTPTASTLSGDPAKITNKDAPNVSGWTNDPNTPYFAEGGDRYSYGSSRYNSLSACEDAGHNFTECAHYHVGNYYNWTASVAMSSTGAYTADYTVMPNSICPKGWRLPNGLTDNGGVVAQSDYNALLIAQNITGNSDTVGHAWIEWNGSGFGNIESNPLYFTRSGNISQSALLNFNSYGFYWSSTVNSSNKAYAMAYGSSGFGPANEENRFGGRAVRCMVR